MKKPGLEGDFRGVGSVLGELTEFEKMCQLLRNVSRDRSGFRGGCNDEVLLIVTRFKVNHSK